MITRINNNRGRRFLNPLEVEAQYVTEDRANDPDLIFWVDFTDVSSLRSVSSGGSAPPTAGESILLAYNKAYLQGDLNENMTTAGNKALGQYVAQTGASSLCPTFLGGNSGNPSFAVFNGSQFLEATKQNSGSVNNTDFSTSDIDLNTCTMYFVCKRLTPDVDQRQDVFFMTTNDYGAANPTPNQWLSFSFADTTSYKGTLEIYDANQISGRQLRYTEYDTTDDRKFHYHMWNSYEMYNNNQPTSGYTSLQADGFHHQFSEFSSSPGDYPSPTYMRLWNPGFTMSGMSGTGWSGGLNETFEFTGASLHHPSITIGGQPRMSSSEGATGTFKGFIYEVLIFKNEHSGPRASDVIFFNRNFKRRWSNMLYYFQRKYQYIANKF
tara:strand:- start:43 stop:1185 length:1143 start_codon:yes stop_codon:yes gene_type:complete